MIGNAPGTFVTTGTERMARSRAGRMALADQLRDGFTTSIVRSNFCIRTMSVTMSVVSSRAKVTRIMRAIFWISAQFELVQAHAAIPGTDCLHRDAGGNRAVAVRPAGSSRRQDA
jgi:hypothetical protein